MSGPRLRVVMFPAASNGPDDNPYLDLLVRALRAADVEVIAWRKHLSMQRGDIFHVHWPELPLAIGRRRGHWLRGRLIEANLRATMARVRRAGGRTVWTVHNLRPHDADNRGARWMAMMRRFVPRVDHAIALTGGGVAAIRAAYPALGAVSIVPHPHYRDALMPSPRSRDAVRGELGIAPGQCAIAVLGSMRGNKGVLAAVAAWRELDPVTCFLILAGGASPAMQAEIRAAVGNAGNADVAFGRVPAVRLAELHAACDIILFPGGDYLNSATIFTALSYDRPVAVMASPTNLDLRAAIGARWVRCATSPIDGAVLTTLLDDLPAPGDRCPLDGFAPAIVAHRTIAAYRAALDDDGPVG